MPRPTALLGVLASAVTAAFLVAPAAHADTCGSVTITPPAGFDVVCNADGSWTLKPQPGYTSPPDPTQPTNPTDPGTSTPDPTELLTRAIADADAVETSTAADLTHVLALVKTEGQAAYKKTRADYLAKKNNPAKARKAARKARAKARANAKSVYDLTGVKTAAARAAYCRTVLDTDQPWTQPDTDRCVWSNYLNPTPTPTPTPGGGGGGEDKVATSISDLTIPAGAPQKPATTKAAAKAMMKTYYPSMFDRERPELWSTGETILDDFAYAAERGGKAHLYRTTDPRVAIFVMDYTDLAGVRHLEFRVVSGDFYDSLTVEGVTVKDFAASLTATWSPKLPPSAIEHGILYATPIENVALVGYAAGDTPGVDESIGVDERGRGGWAHLEKGRN